MRYRKTGVRWAWAVLFCGAVLAVAQDSSPASETYCRGVNVISVPSRPTVTSATDTTACGVVEVEYGLERQWPGGGANRDDLTGGLRIGVTPNLDFRWSSSDFLHIMDGTPDRTIDRTTDRTGFGDTWLSLRYRFLKQTKRHPSLGVVYAVKAPSASAGLGFGAERVDHSLSFLASKDVHRLHFDFNLIELMAGRPGASGFDHNDGFALASWLTVTHRLCAVFEPYGYTELNRNDPAFASAMIGGNYRVHPRLYLDGGLDVGATAAAPNKRVFVGITYAIGNVYSWLRPIQ